MIYKWSPNNSDVIAWQPSSGWNNSFTQKDKIHCANLFLFFKNSKKYNDSTAEILADMVIYKEKYAGLRYSDEQEQLLEFAMKPVGDVGDRLLTRCAF